MRLRTTNEDCARRPQSVNEGPNGGDGNEQSPTNQTKLRRRIISGLVSVLVTLLLSGTFLWEQMQLLRYNPASLYSESSFMAPQAHHKQDSSLSIQMDLPQHKNNDLSRTIGEETRFCLVHVGKTAGSKLSCELGMHNLDYFHCAQNHTYSPSALRKAFAGHVHIHRVHHYKCEEAAGVNAFLVTLRNPLDRLVSWYYFEHPRDFHGPKRIWRYNVCTKK
jgi:hypothetical protein